MSRDYGSCLVASLVHRKKATLGQVIVCNSCSLQMKIKRISYCYDIYSSEKKHCDDEVTCILTEKPIKQNLKCASVHAGVCD